MPKAFAPKAFEQALNDEDVGADIPTKKGRPDQQAMVNELRQELETGARQIDKLREEFFGVDPMPQLPPQQQGRLSQLLEASTCEPLQPKFSAQRTIDKLLAQAEEVSARCTPEAVRRESFLEQSQQNLAAQACKELALKMTAMETEVAKFWIRLDEHKAVVESMRQELQSALAAHRMHSMEQNSKFSALAADIVDLKMKMLPGEISPLPELRSQIVQLRTDLLVQSHLHRDLLAKQAESDGLREGSAATCLDAAPTPVGSVQSLESELREDVKSIKTLWAEILGGLQESVKKLWAEMKSRKDSDERVADKMESVEEDIQRVHDRTVMLGQAVQLVQAIITGSQRSQGLLIRAVETWNSDSNFLEKAGAEAAVLEEGSRGKVEEANLKRALSRLLADIRTTAKLTKASTVTPSPPISPSEAIGEGAFGSPGSPSSWKGSPGSPSFQRETHRLHARMRGRVSSQSNVHDQQSQSPHPRNQMATSLERESSTAHLPDLMPPPLAVPGVVSTGRQDPAAHGEGLLVSSAGSLRGPLQSRSHVPHPPVSLLATAGSVNPSPDRSPSASPSRMSSRASSVAKAPVTTTTTATTARTTARAATHSPIPSKNPTTAIITVRSSVPRSLPASPPSRTRLVMRPTSRGARGSLPATTIRPPVMEV